MGGSTLIALGFIMAASAAISGQEMAVQTAQQVMPMVAPKLYNCENGEQVSADFDEPAGLVRAVRRGEVVTLFRQVGHSLPTYVTGSDTVVLDGEKAVLTRGMERRLECHLQPEQPTAGVIFGTISKADPTPLEAGTRARILLVDAARADAPAVEIASATLVTTGNQMPLHFRINYPADLHPARPMTYRLQARIESAKGKLLAITDTATFVLEKDEPQPAAELTLVPAASE